MQQNQEVHADSLLFLLFNGQRRECSVTFYCVVTKLNFVGLRSEGIDMERSIKTQIIKGCGQRTVINVYSFSERHFPEKM